MLMTRRTRLVIAAATVAMMTLAACGSTVSDQAADQLTRGAPEDGLAVSPEEANTGDGPQGSVPGADGAASDPGVRGGSATKPQRPSGEAGSSALAPSGGKVASGKKGKIPVGKGARGVDDSTIKVGLWTVDSRAADAAIGAASGAVFEHGTDFAKAAKAMADHINKNGGIAGRKLVPVLHQVDASQLVTPSGREREMQRACARWTEDNRVFAFMPTPGGNGALECARTHNTVMIGSHGAAGQAGVSNAMLERYRNLWYSPNGMTAERRGKNLVAGLWKQGFINSASKIGIVIEDRQASRDEVRNGMLPELRRHGVNPVVQITYPDGLSAPWDNYMLQMQRSGVTHILPSSSEIKAHTMNKAMTAAQSQRYFPKWGYSTDLFPIEVAALGAPRQQLANTQGIGWSPTIDTYDTTSLTSSGKVCEKVIRESGSGPLGGIYCEMLFFVKHTLDRAPELSVAGMNAALSQVRSGYVAVTTHSGKTRFASNRPDGADVYRYFVYDNRCTSEGHRCWKYTTPAAKLS